MSIITSEEYVKFMEGPNRLFIDVLQNSACPVIDKIHPLKQKYVDSIYRIVKEKYSDIIKRVIIFGSSVTWSCLPESDLDLCIDWYTGQVDPESGMYSRKAVDALCDIKGVIDGECDVLDYDERDTSRILQDINKKGVVIYEKLI